MAKELKPVAFPALTEEMGQAVALFDTKDVVTGLEDVTPQDLSLPRLAILQDGMSDQLKPKKAEFIEGAKAGQFCDTALGRVWDSIAVIPCYFARIYLEWKPERGEGLVANHGLDVSVVRGLSLDNPKYPGTWRTKGGNLIVETPTYYVLNMTEPVTGRRGFIPLTSSQVKRSKRWMDQITTEKLMRADGSKFPAPLYWRVWFTEAVEESNNKGDWFGWKFTPGPNILELDPTHKVLEAAQQFAKDAKDGLVQLDVTKMENEAGDGGAF